MTYDQIYTIRALLSDMAALPLGPHVKRHIYGMLADLQPAVAEYERRRADIDPDDPDDPDDPEAIAALGATDHGDVDGIWLYDTAVADIIAAVDNGCTDPMFTRLTPDHLIDRHAWLETVARYIPVESEP